MSMVKQIRNCLFCACVLPLASSWTSVHARPGQAPRVKEKYTFGGVQRKAVTFKDSTWIPFSNPWKGRTRFDVPTRKTIDVPHFVQLRNRILHFVIPKRGYFTERGHHFGVESFLRETKVSADKENGSFEVEFQRPAHDTHPFTRPAKNSFHFPALRNNARAHKRAAEIIMHDILRNSHVDRFARDIVIKSLFEGKELSEDFIEQTKLNAGRAAALGVTDAMDNEIPYKGALSGVANEILWALSVSETSPGMIKIQDKKMYGLSTLIPKSQFRQAYAHLLTMAGHEAQIASTKELVDSFYENGELGTQKKILRIQSVNGFDESNDGIGDHATIEITLPKQ